MILTKKKSEEKKVGKKSRKIADFSTKNPIFSRKNPIFPEIWGKLYFRSLRGEKLKNGAKQSCIIKKSVFWTVGPTVSLYSLSCHIYPLSLLALSLLSPQKNIIFSQNSLDSKKYEKINSEGFQTHLKYLNTLQLSSH